MKTISKQEWQNKPADYKSVIGDQRYILTNTEQGTKLVPVLVEGMRPPRASYPKDLPQELRGLWKAQYAPYERLIKKNLDKQTLKQWDSQSYTKKLVVIDRMKAKGYFD